MRNVFETSVGVTDKHDNSKFESQSALVNLASAVKNLTLQLSSLQNGNCNLKDNSTYSSKSDQAKVTKLSENVIFVGSSSVLIDTGQWCGWIKVWAGACLRFLVIYIGGLVKNQFCYYTTFLTIDIALSMKFKRDILFIMKFKVPWSLLLENMVQFFTLLYQFFMKIKIGNVP